MDQRELPESVIEKIKKEYRDARNEEIVIKLSPRHESVLITTEKTEHIGLRSANVK
ncbi:hypothetical protein AGMMS49940_15380 [Spirochaetia bacterium]|nr:hypothetical protein AGMMS49940_15380 [Spirochaetia bacterium]